jgi:hypothetical protein
MQWARARTIFLASGFGSAMGVLGYETFRIRPLREQAARVTRQLADAKLQMEQHTHTIHDALAAREKLEYLATEGRGINKMAIWSMFAVLPITAQTIECRLLANDPHLFIRSDYAVALATSSSERFYKLVPVLFQRNVARGDGERNAQLFHDLFNSLRDIHDEHDFVYRSPHTLWPGKFTETRKALQWLVERPEVPKHALRDNHIVHEYLRVSDIHRDMIDRKDCDAPTMRSKVHVG